jgi:hypothetical protein
MDIGKGGQNVSSRNKLDCPYHEIIIQWTCRQIHESDEDINNNTQYST